MIRPVDISPSQLYGDNPTRWLPWDSWLIQTFGNYQPDGHTGEDYPCKAGTPVRAVTSGTVLHIGRLAGTYADNPWWIAPSFAGYVVVIDHGWFIGIYGHCMDGSGRFTAGQHVNEGDVVVLSGNTGASTGDHLHFEALLKGALLNSYMYGRINPATLYGSLAYSSSGATQGTTTTLEEGFLMALSDAQQADIYWILCTQDGREYLAELVGGRSADKTLNTPVIRGGAGAAIGDGKTSLGALVAWNDDHTIQLLSAAAASAAQSGASVEEIQAAVKQALADGVVKVEVTVEDRK